MTSRLCNVHVCRVAEEVSIAAHMLGGGRNGDVLDVGFFFNWTRPQTHRRHGQCSRGAGP